mmetsp:Transcript_34035/g.119015  ORF Transcript_34035/g.119015 Transcript_34035/m.119015 type:complete len:182 (+) Transcript_34035:77-622(+)
MEAAGAPRPRRATVVRAAAVDELRAMKVADLRQALGERGISWASYIEKEELVTALAGAMANEENFCPSGLVTLGAVSELTGEGFEIEVQSDSKALLLVDVYATWCGPCLLMAPELAKAAKTLGAKARVAKIDSDKEPDLASRLKVSALPTILLFRGGEEVGRVEGAMMAAQLVKFVEAYAA